jgi:hypothetical protein
MIDVILLFTFVRCASALQVSWRISWGMIFTSVDFGLAKTATVAVEV